MKIVVVQLSALVSITFIVWIISYKIGKVSIIDRFWSVFFLVASLIAWLLSPTPLVIILLIGIPLILWAIRLALHITLRSLKKGEDPRYVNLRKSYAYLGKTWALWTVFLPQAVLAWFINMPITVALTSELPFFSWGLAIFGLVLFVLGFLFEAIADAQLLMFQKRRANREQVLERGLWAWSRHPNYFGEAVLWWGFYFISVGISGSMLTLFSPLLMTFLLLKVSGVSMLDTHLKETKPQYEDYMRKTSAFFPWPPKKK